MKIKKFIQTNPALQKYLTDFWLKAIISLGSSLVINILYAIWEIISGIYYHSFWFTTLGCYYVLLSAIRFLLLREADKEDHAAWEKYRICGVFLLLMNLILSGIVVLAVKDNQGSEYAGYLIYVVALYTFCKITVSVRNMVKYRKVCHPVLSASKAISFTSSVVSMLSLEIAMNRQFGDDPLFFQRMTILTGTGACIVISVTAIHMILTAHKNMRQKNCEYGNIILRTRKPEVFDKFAYTEFSLRVSGQRQLLQKLQQFNWSENANG
ncbi:MAG: hypothetical protein LIO67_02920 [Lachnospiraceae bacterium]|nr:hypothetical protein [Lachnospiraceae bacterium]